MQSIEFVRKKGIIEADNPKPHPESLFKILSFFGIDPDGAIYVGDSLVDFQTARAAGVLFFAYKNRGLEADYHLDRLMDIAELLAP